MGSSEKEEEKNQFFVEGVRFVLFVFWYLKCQWSQKLLASLHHRPALLSRLLPWLQFPKAGVREKKKRKKEKVNIEIRIINSSDNWQKGQILPLFWKLKTHRRQVVTCVAFYTHPATKQRAQGKRAGWTVKAAAPTLALFPPGSSGCLTSPAPCFQFTEWLEWRSPKLSHCLAQGSSSSPAACSGPASRNTDPSFLPAAHSLCIVGFSLPMFDTWQSPLPCPGSEPQDEMSFSRKENTRIRCSAKYFGQ